jgi:hypothetical protein
VDGLILVESQFPITLCVVRPEVDIQLAKGKGVTVCDEEHHSRMNQRVGKKTLIPRDSGQWGKTILTASKEVPLERKIAERVTSE